MYSAGQQYGKILWNSRFKFKPPLTLLQTKFGAPSSVSVLHKGSWQQKNEKQSPPKSAPKEVFVVCNHGLSDIDHVIHTETNMINRYTLCGHCNILGYDASYDQAHWGPAPSDGHRYMSSSDIHSSRQGKKRTSLWYAGAQNHHHMLGSNQYSEMSSHFSSKSLWKYSPFSNTSKTDANWIVIRSFHSSQPLWKEESKAEKTVKALKSEVEKKEAEKKEAIPEKQEPPSFALPEEKKEIAEAPVPKKTISQRIVAELKHYYHGFRLLFIDVRVCSKLLWLVLNGKSLSRRERRQLVRTTADLFRLVPFLVFIIVPFMEFLLPVALKLFPGMLPSTFMEEDREKEKFRKNLKLKLEMAKFLQDTIEETALQRKGAKGDKVTEFVEFLNKIRTTGHGASNEEIMKYCKLFEDEITLDNLNHRQLRALCNLVEIPTMGTSNFLRFQLRLKLRQLEADDRMIQKEGLNSLAVWELQEASRARGMRAVGVPIDRLKLQLQQWLDLHLNHQIPTSLLLLSRTLYLPESVPTEEQLKATISQLPETTAGEAKVKISEVTGDRIDNKIKLEIIKQEQEAIKQEEAERKNEEEKLEKAKVEEKKRKEEEEKAKVEEVPEMAPKPEQIMEEVITKTADPTIIIDHAPEMKTRLEEILKDQAEEIKARVEEVISSEDFTTIENVLEAAAAVKNIPVQEEELKHLKEDMTEYKEALENLKEVVVATGAEELIESKAAQRLSKRVDKLVGQMDVLMTDINKDKAVLMENIEVKEVKMKRSLELQEDVGLREEVQDQIDKEKANVISMNELILAMRRLQKLPDEDKLQKIAQVLDEDHDGVIDVTDALRVIELLGQENIKLSGDQVGEIMSLLKREELFELEEKERKIKEKREKNNLDIGSTEEIKWDKAGIEPTNIDKKAIKESEKQ